MDKKLTKLEKVDNGIYNHVYSDGTIEEKKLSQA